MSHVRLPRIAKPGAVLGVALALGIVGSARGDAERIPLAPLPKPPSLEIAAPRPEDLATLDALLARLVGADPVVRETSLREIVEADPRLLSAVHARIDTVAERTNRKALDGLLRGTREKAKRAGDDRESATADYAEMLLSHARPDSAPWRDLVSAIALGRILAHFGTVEAVREIIRVHARFGEAVRIEVQRQLGALGERAVAGLIEAERHPAPAIAKWASHELETLGKKSAGDAVQTADPQVLADVLVALGRVRDPETARIVLSFASSDRAQVRLAARQSIAVFGEVAAWQIRDAYEQTLGERAPRDWSWDRTARELFRRLDRMRLAQTYDLFDEGARSLEKNDLDAMRTAWDRALAESPLFEQRGEMAKGYVAWARAHLDAQTADAVTALTRAARIASDPRDRDAAESLLATAEAERLLDRGLCDSALLRRALELDASNERARSDLARCGSPQTAASGSTARWGVSAVLGAIAAFGALWVLLRRGKDRDSAPEPSTEKPS